MYRRMLLSLLLLLSTKASDPYQLALFFPFSFTDNGNSISTSYGLSRTDFLQVALSSVALDQINKRDKSVLPEAIERFLQAEELGCNISFSYNIFDSGRDQSFALKQFVTVQEQFKEQIYANRLGIIGPQRSSVSVPLSFVASSQNVPMISYAATSVDLDDKSKHPFFIRTIPSDLETTSLMVQFLSLLNLEAFSLIYIDDAYGKNFKDGLEKSSKSLEIDIHSVPFDPYTNPGSLAEAVTTLKNLKLNVIIAIVFQDIIKELIEEAYKQKVGAEFGHLWIFGDSIGGSSNIQSDADNTQFIQGINGAVQILATSKDETVEEYKHFQTVLKSFQVSDELISKLPGGEQYSGYNPRGEQTVFPDLSVEDIGDLSLFAFDAVFAYGLGLVDSCLDETDFVATMKTPNFGFKGLSGSIEFGETLSRREGTTKFSITRFKFENFVLKADEIGYYKSGWFLKESDETHDFLHHVPRYTNLPAPDTNNVLTSTRVFCIVLASFLLIFCFGCYVWLDFNQSEKVLKASQPLFLKVILLGALVSTSSVYFKGYNPETFGYNYTEYQLMHESQETGGIFFSNLVDGTSIERNDLITLSRLCGSSWWLISLGLTLTNLGFIVKLHRIISVFKLSAKLRKASKAPSEMKLLQRVGIVILFNITLLVFWAMSMPFVYEEEPISFDEFGQPIEVIRRCTIEINSEETSAIAGRVFLIVLLLSFHLMQYAIGVNLSYKARNLPGDFQEARWLSIAFFTQFQLILLGCTIVFALEAEDQNLQVLVVNVLVILVNFSIISMIFLPKMHRLYYGPKDVSLERGTTYLETSTGANSKPYTTL
eukprot:snap_masked-scaffold_32-processed-gene-3.19-mRNA-1 protein AED:1.00 eAED:1.00 QI:0/0/0/0/1/1/2/0/823